MPGEEGKPVFIVYRHEDIQQMLRDNETFSSSAVIQAFGAVLGKRVMLGMDEPDARPATAHWSPRRSPRRRWRAGKTSSSAESATS